ncbi:hypothetical protein AGMMS4956_03880 [Bacteroidia bacterium]|nr:hypothetical protein AGMMS4956_03880 [Bacteroidia bacterium]
MKTYSYTEAYRSFPMILDAALMEDVVIKRKNTNAFEVVYTNNNRSLSPFEVAGISSDITTQEIVDCVKEGRRR